MAVPNPAHPILPQGPPWVPSHPPAGCPAPCWSELVQASALGFHLLSAKVALHCFAVKIKKQLEGKNPWLLNRAEQPQTSHPGEEESRESGAAWGHPGLDFDTLQKTRCFYLIVWVPTFPVLPHVRRRRGWLFGLAAEPRTDKEEPDGKGAATAEGQGEVVEIWDRLPGLALPSPLPAPPQRRVMVQGEEVPGGCPQAPRYSVAPYFHSPLCFAISLS